LKSAGQSNYAAGCAFKDAFARANVWSRPDGTVKVINWGYWGSVGIAASQERETRLAKVGLASIESPEAMAVLEALLTGPLDQVALVTTTGAAELPAIAGVSHSERLAVYAAERVSHISSPLTDACASTHGWHDEAGEEHVVDRITAVLLQAASELLNVKAEDLDVHVDLHDYGLDLVSLAGLIDRLNREYQLDEVARRTGTRPLTPTLVLEHRDGQTPTLYGLAQFLVAEYATVFGGRDCVGVGGAQRVAANS